MARLSSKASDTILSSYRDHVALGPTLRPARAPRRDRPDAPAALGAEPDPAPARSLADEGLREMIERSIARISEAARFVPHAVRVKYPQSPGAGSWPSAT
jgi:hypothetical protein